MLINLQFDEDNYKVNVTSGFKGWQPIDQYNTTLKLPAEFGKGWYWEHDIIPLDRNIKPELTDEAIAAAYSKWDATACANPVTNQYYIAGDGAQFIQDVTVRVTDRLTAEFWFRADLDNMAAAE